MPKHNKVVKVFARMRSRTNRTYSVRHQERTVLWATILVGAFPCWVAWGSCTRSYGNSHQRTDRFTPLQSAVWIATFISVGRKVYTALAIFPSWPTVPEKIFVQFATKTTLQRVSVCQILLQLTHKCIHSPSVRIWSIDTKPSESWICNKSKVRKNSTSQSILYIVQD